VFDRFLCKLFTKLFPSFLAKNPKLRAPENEIRRRHFGTHYDKEEEEEEDKDREDKEDDDAIVSIILVFQ
jgi:hypothetical protein